MVTNVTSLLKTVKAVEDEHTRGTRALESTIEAIAQEMEHIKFKDGIEKYDKGQLTHTETMEKNTLPTKEVIEMEKSA